MTDPEGVEERCEVCDSLMVPEGEGWKCPDCPPKGGIESYGPNIGDVDTAEGQARRAEEAFFGGRQ